MRRGLSPSIALTSAEEPGNFDRWQQAGFSSSAYRLAHFGLPRPLLVFSLTLVLFFC